MRPLCGVYIRFMIYLHGTALCFFSVEQRLDLYLTLYFASVPSSNSLNDYVNGFKIIL